MIQYHIILKLTFYTIFIAISFDIKYSHGLKLSEYLKETNNILTVVHGTGRNFFAITSTSIDYSKASQTPKYLIAHELLDSLGATEKNITIRIDQLPDDIVIAMPRRGVIEDDRPPPPPIVLEIEPKYYFNESDFEKMKGKYILIENSFGLGSR